MPTDRPSTGRSIAVALIGFAVIAGVLIGFGELVTHQHNVLGDLSVPRWFAAHRTSTLTPWSAFFTDAAAVPTMIIASVVACILTFVLTRQWRPVIFVGASMAGELGLFLVSAAVVKRGRPPVSHLDQHLPTSSYPSGHLAATICLFTALAILIIGRSRSRWRWLILVPAIAMPPLVAVSRLYRGMHHPTDILGSVILAVLWITVLYLAVRPNAPAGTGSPHTHGSARSGPVLVAGREAA